MTDEQRAVFASSLDGHENGQGFLLLEPRRPLCLQTRLDGPNATLGSAGSVGSEAVLLFLEPGPLGRQEVVSGTTTYGYDLVRTGSISSLVLPEQRLEVQLPGPLRGLADKLEVRNVRQQGAWRC
jgi:hypothetical protein